LKAPLDWQRDMGWHDAATGRPLIEFGICKPDYIEVVASPRGRELVVIDAKVCGNTATVYVHHVHTAYPAALLMPGGLLWNMEQASSHVKLQHRVQVGLLVWPVP